MNLQLNGKHRSENCHFHKDGNHCDSWPLLRSSGSPDGGRAALSPSRPSMALLSSQTRVVCKLFTLRGSTWFIQEMHFPLLRLGACHQSRSDGYIVKKVQLFSRSLSPTPLRDASSFHPGIHQQVFGMNRSSAIRPGGLLPLPVSCETVLGSGLVMLARAQSHH